MSKHLNQSRLAVMPACLLVVLWMSVMALHANPEEKVENNVWTSVDGRKIQAQGLAWTPRGVLVKKPGQKDAVLVPYKSLQADDVNRAVSGLPFERNEDITLKVPIAEKTKEIDKKLIGVEDKTVHLDDKYGNRQIFKKERSDYTYTNLSGYNLEIHVKSNSDPCMVWLEVYGLCQSDNDRKIYMIHQEKLKIGLGTKVAIWKVTCPPKQRFDGWVALCRSNQSGKIVAMASSGWQYDAYAREGLSNPILLPSAQESNVQVREEIIMKPPDEYREKILEDLKLRKTE